MSSRSRCNARGSTLIESLVALSLFGMTAATIGNLLVSQIRMQAWNATKTTGIGLAQAELEDLRAMDYTKISSRTVTQTVGGMRYTVATTVTPDSPGIGLKTILTTVTWLDATGPQNYSLNAIYTAVKR